MMGDVWWWVTWSMRARTSTNTWGGQWQSQQEQWLSPPAKQVGLLGNCQQKRDCHWARTQDWQKKWDSAYSVTLVSGSYPTGRAASMTTVVPSWAPLRRAEPVLWNRTWCPWQRFPPHWAESILRSRPRWQPRRKMGMCVCVHEHPCMYIHWGQWTDTQPQLQGVIKVLPTGDADRFEDYPRCALPRLTMWHPAGECRLPSHSLRRC